MTTAVEPIPLYKEQQTFYVPAFEIQVRGAPMPREVVRDIVEVTYEDNIDKVDSFTLTVNNWDSDTGKPKYFGPQTEPGAGTTEEKLANIFAPNNVLHLLLGYQGSRADLRRMVSGRITTVDLELGEAVPKLMVRGLNVLDVFRNRQYTWSWPEAPPGTTQTIRDSDVATALAVSPDDVAGRPGLGPDVRVRVDSQAAGKEPPQEHIFMNNEFPIVFLLQRARRLGYVVAYEGRDDSGKHVIYFGPSPNLRDKTYELEWGRSLVSLKVNVGTARQVKKVTVLGWDRKAKKPIKSEATFQTLVDAGEAINPKLRAMAEDGGREDVVTDPPVYTQKDADELARRLLRANHAEMVTVSGVTVGLPDLRAGKRVRLSRIDYRVDGWFFVTGTTHTLNEAGYRTTFTARREDSGAPS
jgi:phage protein D